MNAPQILRKLAAPRCGRPIKPKRGGSSRTRLTSKAWLVLALALGWRHPASLGQEVTVIVSAKGGERLAKCPAVRFASSTGLHSNTFRIDDHATFQAISGFGASFLEAGMLCLNSLPMEAQEKVLESLFDPIRGAGFSAMKTPLAGTDFMSAGPWYTYDDTPGDVEMKHFSIARDLGANGLVTFIKRAQKHGHFVLQAPMDYPPDWMLIDLRTNQDVNPKYYDALALYYLRYLQEYEKHGVHIDYLSLFNEPGVYTKISYRSIRDLLLRHVAPQLARSALRTRLMLSEAPARAEAAKNYPVVLDDPEARRCVAVVPYHGYDLTAFAAIARLHARYPDLPLWMTELCHAYEAGTSKQMKLPRIDFDDGDFWGQQIFSDLEAGASAWIYWNLILDQNGGPWLVSPIHGNPEENIQHPVLIINRATHEVTYTGCYYYLAHFSKFVRPGAVRVAVTGSVKDARCLAFRTPEGGLVAELMNSRDAANEVRLDFGSQSLDLTLAPRSITTCLWHPGR
ncbi:putative Glucosylceramidase [Verrucomicrobia bacterium]|nr:putative Glucosylceramidase [Verrucomicrobiota bacterium]